MIFKQFSSRDQGRSNPAVYHLNGFAGLIISTRSGDLSCRIRLRQKHFIECFKRL